MQEAQCTPLLSTSPDASTHDGSAFYLSFRVTIVDGTCSCQSLESPSQCMRKLWGSRVCASVHTSYISTRDLLLLSSSSGSLVPETHSHASCGSGKKANLILPHHTTGWLLAALSCMKSHSFSRSHTSEPAPVPLWWKSSAALCCMLCLPEICPEGCHQSLSPHLPVGPPITLLSP